MKDCSTIDSRTASAFRKNCAAAVRLPRGVRLGGFAIAMLASTPLLLGCSSSSFSMDDVRARLAERPAHLDVLDMLKGTWTTEGTIEFIGQDAPTRVTGRSTASWDCDGRVLIDHSDYELADFGPMRGVSIWTANEKPGRFQMHWFDSFGETATGTATWNAATNTLNIRTKGKNAICNVVNDGTIRKIDANTLEWTWQQHDATRIVQYSTMRGTSKRVR